MGQIVQYQLQGQKPNPKTLKWIDSTQVTDDKNDKDTPGQTPGASPKKQMLAKLVPIKETLNFEKRVNCHHSKT